jgi:hypothetical protein
VKTVVTKGQYAELKSRTPGTVSHWIAEGKISAGAMIGIGRNARVWVEQADADLARSLDPAQQAAQENPISNAQGVEISTPSLPQAAAASPHSPPTGHMGLADQPSTSATTDNEALRRRRQADAEKAEYEAEAARRKLAIDEGRWVDAAEAARTWAAEVARMVSETETFLTNALARELADEFKCDWKVLAARIRDGYRRFRSGVADNAAAEREAHAASEAAA